MPCGGARTPRASPRIAEPRAMRARFLARQAGVPTRCPPRGHSRGGPFLFHPPMACFAAMTSIGRLRNGRAAGGA